VCDLKVAWISVSQEKLGSDETGCSTNRSLPGHAGPVTARYEASGTM
jgi:hypothetical protein